MSVLSDKPSNRWQPYQAGDYVVITQYHAQQGEVHRLRSKELCSSWWTMVNPDSDIFSENHFRPATEEEINANNIDRSRIYINNRYAVSFIKIPNETISLNIDGVTISKNQFLIVGRKAGWI